MYNRLYDAWRKERLGSRELQPLPQGFFRDLSEYIRRMTEELRMLDEKTLKYRLLRMELEKTRQMASSLMDTRLRKLVETSPEDRTLSREHITDEEEELYSRVLQVFEQHESFKKRVLEGRGIDARAKPPRESGIVTVRFTAAVPKIVGVDMKMYGPFAPEDVASLPRENAEALIRQRAAIKIDVEE